jgi:hypothetical protein
MLQSVNQLNLRKSKNAALLLAQINDYLIQYTIKIGYKWHRWTLFEILRNVGQVPWQLMKKEVFLRWLRLLHAHCNNSIPLWLSAYFFFFSYERMLMFLDSIKDVSEDTIMHEYVYDTFREMFRDSNYDIIW